MYSDCISRSKHNIYISHVFSMIYGTLLHQEITSMLNTIRLLGNYKLYIIDLSKLYWY